jgi:hypothetical protein
VVSGCQEQQTPELAVGLNLKGIHYREPVGQANPLSNSLLASSTYLSI